MGFSSILKLDDFGFLIFSSLVLADKSRRHLPASWKPRLVCPGEGAAPMQDDLVLQKEEMDTSECLVLTV